MNRLSKNDIAKKVRLQKELEKARDKLEAVLNDLADQWDDLFAPIEEAVAAYNEVLATCREFTEDVHASMRDYFDSKSERWQESNVGEAYTDWMEQWEVSGIDYVEFEIPERPSPEQLDFAHVEHLEELPEEP